MYVKVINQAGLSCTAVLSFYKEHFFCKEIKNISFSQQ